MKLALPSLVVLALLAPTVSAQAPTAEYPSTLTALLPAWFADAEAMAANSTEAPWYPEAKRFLDSGREAQEQGRFRSAVFDLETFTELVIAGQLADEGKSLPSDAERRTMILQRTLQWHTEARGAFDAYRARLDGIEDDIRSLHGLEIAMYSAEQALTARLMTNDREFLARDFPKQPTVDRGYVLALVRSSHTALLTIGWAEDILDTVSTYEGLPPKVNETAWDTIRAVALAPREGAATNVEAYAAIGDEARAANESILATVVNLGEQRSSRATNIYVIYGDATSRNLDVVGDATRAMGKQLANASMDEPREYGLLGVFQADAIDRAQKTHEFATDGKADLNLVIAAWASLDHARYVTLTLGGASPIQPAAIDETPVKTPVAAWAAVAALGVAALAAGRRKA